MQILRVLLATSAMIALGACSGPVAQEVAEVSSSILPSTTVLDSDFSDPVRANSTTLTTQPGAEVVTSPIERAFGAIVDPDNLSELIQSSRIEMAAAVSECVRQQGFDGWVEPVDNGPTPEQLAASDRSQLGSLTEGGYGAALTLRGTWFTIMNPTGGPVSEINPIDEYVSGLSEQARPVFTVERAGCRSKARSEYPDPVFIPQQIAQEVADLRAQAMTSPEVVAVEDEWAACMRNGGFPARDRNDARDQVWSKRSPVENYLNTFLGSNHIPNEEEQQRFEDLMEPLENLEKMVVETDLRCATQLDEFTIRREILWEAEQEWLDSNQDRVALLLAE